jgi:hypothetical protein
MEQAAELAFVDHRHFRREPTRTRDSLDWSNRPAPSLLAEAAPAPVRGESGLRRPSQRGKSAPVRGESGLRRPSQRGKSAPVSRQKGGSLAVSALQPRLVLASSDALSLREFVQLFIIGAFVLLSPVLVFLAAIAAEIAIDILVQAGGAAVAAFVAAGAIGWLLRKLWRRQGGVPVEA